MNAGINEGRLVKISKPMRDTLAQQVPTNSKNLFLTEVEIRRRAETSLVYVLGRIPRRCFGKDIKVETDYEVEEMEAHVTQQIYVKDYGLIVRVRGYQTLPSIFM